MHLSTGTAVPGSIPHARREHSLYDARDRCAERDDDHLLLGAMASGDQEAFAALVKRHSHHYYTVAYRVLGRREDAEEVLQDALLMLWTRPEVWDSGRGTKFTTWFYRVILNKSLDILRKNAAFTKAVNIQDVMDTLEDAVNLELAFEAEQRRQQIKRAVYNLPARQRMAVVLCFYKELPQSEAARILRISIKALESLLMRAKLTLRRDLMGLMDKSYYENS